MLLFKEGSVLMSVSGLIAIHNDIDAFISEGVKHSH